MFADLFATVSESSFDILVRSVCHKSTIGRLPNHRAADIKTPIFRHRLMPVKYGTSRSLEFPLLTLLPGTVELLLTAGVPVILPSSVRKAPRTMAPSLSALSPAPDGRVISASISTFLLLQR